MYLLVNQVIISLEQIRRLVLTDIMAAYINTTRHSVDYCSELLLTEAQCWHHSLIITVVCSSHSISMHQLQWYVPDNVMLSAVQLQQIPNIHYDLITIMV